MELCVANDPLKNLLQQGEQRERYSLVEKLHEHSLNGSVKRRIWCQENSMEASIL